MLWINTTLLKNWTPLRDLQQNLPLVIRRLVRATVNDISRISFPAGDSVMYEGFDGELEVEKGTEYVPDGISVWEIGTSKNVKKKANNDYNKRTQDPLEVNTEETIFIFVTNRVWTKKKKWCEEKNQEGIWKEFESMML